MYNEYTKVLKSKFDSIAKKDWIVDDKGDWGIIGTTFEKLVGLTPNDLQIPDFGNIEIKTKSGHRFTYISLFNCTPTGPHYHEVEVIKDLYGYPDSTFKEFKVLCGDIYANKLNKIGYKYYFKISVYRKEKVLKLNVYDHEKHKIEESTYWDFDDLEEKLARKLEYMALINVEKKSVKGKIHFRYKDLKIYKLKGFEKFIDLLEKGLIKVSFKLSIFRDEKRFGKIHDRGTAFLIDEKNIGMLFDIVE